MAGEKYVPPQRRSGAAHASSGVMGNWRRSRSAPELRLVSVGSLDLSSSASSSDTTTTNSSTSSADQSQDSRRWSLPEPTQLEYRPILADVFSREEASIFSKLWGEHRRSQRSGNLDGLAKEVDDYKRNELEFRIWLFSKANLDGWTSFSYAAMQGRQLTDMERSKCQVIDNGIAPAKEVLAVLMKAIKGREAVCNKFSSVPASDEEGKKMAGHEHHVKELQRFYDELSAPPKPKHENIMSLSSWR